jgi:hypothetical protein
MLQFSPTVVNILVMKTNLFSIKLNESIQKYKIEGGSAIHLVIIPSKYLYSFLYTSNIRNKLTK